MRNLIFILLGVLLLSSCNRRDTYPDTPALEYKSLDFGIEQSTGLKVFTLTATFTDGDGDIGYYLDRPNEEIFDDTASEYYYNFNLSLQVQRAGVWKDTTILNEVIDLNVDSIDSDNDTTITYYNDIASARIPYLTQDGQNKGLKGDIKKTAYLPGLLGDTIRFRAFLYDRALHKSNEIFTPGNYIENF
jgi:hypothetical protein